MSPLEIFRIVAQEFASLSDGIVNQWIELSKPLISETNSETHTTNPSRISRHTSSNWLAMVTQQPET